MADSQRINSVNAYGGLDARDLLPLDALVAIQLIPGELANLVEGVERRMALQLLQR